MMKRVLENKVELAQLRKELKAKNFTEIKCEYKAGKYEVSYIEQAMNQKDLALNGLAKGEEMNIAEQNRLRSLGRL